MFTLVSRWWRLPRSERVLTLGLAVLLPVIDLSLRALGFQRTWVWLAYFAPPAVCANVPAHALQSAQRLADLTRAIGARSPWPVTCLRQALALWLVLRRRQLPVELKIGVMRREPPFQAHAWVEIGGIALDPDASAHAAFPAVAPPG